MSAEAEAVSVEDAEKAPEETPGEIAHLLPESSVVLLESGTQVRVVRLKSRQFFKMLRIVTRGGINVLPAIQLRPGMDSEEFITKLSALLLFALPEAEDETIEFVQSMVVPVEEGGTRQQQEERFDRLYSPPSDEYPDGGELYNPEPGDLISIVERIVQVEGKDLLALGKRLQALFGLAQRTGQIPSSATKATNGRGSRKARSLVGGRQRST